jgi:hypothetical protein
MRCATCGAEHDVQDLEPSFWRPDEVFALSSDTRGVRVQQNDDVCRLTLDDDEARCFVRCVLAVRVTDRATTFNWGLWAEVASDSFQRILDRWDDPAQASEPAMSVRLANRVPLTADTLGLVASMRLTGPTTRPALTFASERGHPFVVECQVGVTTHRLVEWLEAMR